MLYYGISAYIVHNHRPKWYRGMSIRPEISRSPVRSLRWTSVLWPRNVCLKLLPDAGFKPVTFKWLISLTDLLTNLDQSLLNQGWNQFLCSSRCSNCNDFFCEENCRKIAFRNCFFNPIKVNLNLLYTEHFWLIIYSSLNFSSFGNAQ